MEEAREDFGVSNEYKENLFETFSEHLESQDVNINDATSLREYFGENMAAIDFTLKNAESICQAASELADEAAEKEDISKDGEDR